MSNFKTVFSRFADDHRRFRSRSGSSEKILYHLSYSNNGVQKLDVSGVTNLYADIQSHRESTDLAIILSRLDPYQVSNMISTYTFDDLLNSEIVDVTSLPKNAGDMLNLVREGQTLFNGLPIAIREEFNYSPEKFISSFGSKEFAEKINNLNVKLNNAQEPFYDISKAGRIKKHVVEKPVESNVEKPVESEV